MKRWLVGVIIGLVLGATAQGSAQPNQLQEIQVSASQNAPLVISPSYGRLVNATVNSEVHYLYFEDPDGTVRIVSIGPRGAIQKARQALQLLSTGVYVVKRTSDAP